MNCRRSKRSGRKNEKLSFQIKSRQKEVGWISLPKIKVIDNMLPTEATHCSLNSFEKLSLHVNFNEGFVKK